jgi:alanine racemase
MLRIHASALRHNLNRFRELAPRSKVLLPVKANAYGCGLQTLFPVFTDAAVDMLGVANCHEAVELRKLGWQKPVLNLGGFFKGSIASIIEYDISASITDVWQVAALDAAAAGKSVSVHLKLDLGMGRIGVRQESLNELVAALKSATNLRVDGIFTHFPIRA